MARGYPAAAVVVVLAAAASAWAQDAGGRHVNHVTPEAQAAIDRYARLVLHPLRSGLKTMKCSLVVTGFRARERATCEYGAEDGLVVTFPPGLEKRMDDADVGTDCIGRALDSFFQERFELSRREFDAELVEKDGRATIVMTEYADGKPDYTSEYELDADGLVAKRTVRPGPQSKRDTSTTAFTWAKRGDLRYVSAVGVAYSGTDADDWSSSMEFAEENGAWIPVRIATTYRWSDGTKKAFDVYVADLVVNGTAVDLPTPWKHENKVSPEAQAAIDAFLRLVYRPEDHGVSSATGAVVALGFERPVRATFEFTTADGVRPTDTEAIEEAQHRRKVVGNAVGYPLRAAFDASAVLQDDEFDATIETIDAARVLAITAYREGKPLFAERCTLDEHGLLRRREFRDLADRGREDEVTTYSWTPFRDRWCLAEIDYVHAEPHASHATYVFRYSDVGGVHLVSSYEVRYLAPETVTLTCHVADLVVNGAKVDLPKPWKHVGVVTADARAAIERATKLVDRLSDHGAKSVRAAITENDAATPWRLSFERGVAFVQPPDGVEPTDAQTNAKNFRYWVPLQFACEGVSIDVDGETDAAFVDRDGVRCLRAAKWRDGVKIRTADYEFDGRGLVVRVIRDASNGSMTFRLGWRSAGERFRVESVEVSVVRSSEPESSAKHRIDWRDVAGTPLPVSISSTFEPPTGERRSWTVKLRDVSINGGSVVDPTAHVNVVSPEAQAAIERYERLVDRPAAHGLTSISALISVEGADGPPLWQFEFKAPSHFAVSPAPGANPTPPQSDKPRHVAELPLGFAYEVLPLPGAAEYDAEIVERGGTKTLLVTTYRNGASLGAVEYALDAIGMPASATCVGRADGLRMTFTWSKVGEKYRVATIEWSWDSKRMRSTPRYADVAGLQLATSVTSTAHFVENGKEGEWTKTVRLRSIVLNGKNVDVADPAAHANVVTPEAKAALDRFAKLVYRPIDHGLRTASGRFLPGGIRFEIAGDRLVVRAPDEDADGRWARIADALRSNLRFPYAGIEVSDGPQFDAEFVEKLGRRVLVVTTFRDGVIASRNEILLDERGLATSMRASGVGAEATISEYRFAWKGIGGQWQIERVECWDSRRPQHVTVAFAFAEASGVHVPVSVKWMVTNIAGVEKAPVFAVEDFVLNGTKVVLPRVKLHDNEVTPEAQSLMDAYARRIRRPSEHGIVTASGAVAPTDPPGVSRRFSYTAPIALAVTLPPPTKPDSPEAQAAIASTRFAMLLGLDGLRLSESLEYDARVVESGGGGVLEVVDYDAGARTATSEFTFDAAGLVASLRRRDGVDPAAPASDVTFRFEWEKVGAVHRIRAAELTVGASKKRYELSLVVIDGVEFVASYSVAVEEGGEKALFRYRVEDLILNGKKVALPKTDAPPTDGAKK